MNLLNLFKSFKNDEAGAVTVDWVVLAAAAVGLGVLVMTTVGPGLTNAANTLVGDITDTQGEGDALTGE